MPSIQDLIDGGPPEGPPVQMAVYTYGVACQMCNFPLDVEGEDARSNICQTCAMHILDVIDASARGVHKLVRNTGRYQVDFNAADCAVLNDWPGLLEERGDSDA